MARISVASKEAYTVKRGSVERCWATDRTSHQIAVGKGTVFKRALFEVSPAKIAPLKSSANEFRHEKGTPVIITSNENSIDDRTTVKSRTFGYDVVVAFVANGFIGTIKHRCRSKMPERQGSVGGGERPASRRNAVPPLLRNNPWFWRFFGLSIVLVLSEAVLVIVIDVGIVLRAELGDAIEFHRHPGQHRNDPIQHRVHRGSILHLDAVPRYQHVLNGGTLQSRNASDVQKSNTIFEAAFSIALGDV